MTDNNFLGLPSSQLIIGTAETRPALIDVISGLWKGTVMLASKSATTIEHLLDGVQNAELSDHHWDTQCALANIHQLTYLKEYHYFFTSSRDQHGNARIRDLSSKFPGRPKLFFKYAIQKYLLVLKEIRQSPRRSNVEHARFFISVAESYVQSLQKNCAFYTSHWQTCLKFLRQHKDVEFNVTQNPPQAESWYAEKYFNEARLQDNDISMWITLKHNLKTVRDSIPPKIVSEQHHTDKRRNCGAGARRRLSRAR